MEWHNKQRSGDGNSLEIRKRTNDQLNCFSGEGVNTMMTEMEPEADIRKRKPSDPEEIKRELDMYMKPFLKA